MNRDPRLQLEPASALRSTAAFTASAPRMACDADGHASRNPSPSRFTISLTGQPEALCFSFSPELQDPLSDVMREHRRFSRRPARCDRSAPR
jgi:hypothetical protein